MTGRSRRPSWPGPRSSRCSRHHRSGDPGARHRQHPGGRGRPGRRLPHDRAPAARRRHATGGPAAGRWSAARSGRASPTCGWPPPRPGLSSPPFPAATPCCSRWPWRRQARGHRGLRARRRGVAGRGRVVGGDDGVALALIGVSVIVADRLATRVTRPARELAQAAALLGDGDLSARSTARGPAELAAAGHAFNAMAERLTGLITAERVMSADLPHRLRTPLTALRMNAAALGPWPGRRRHQARHRPAGAGGRPHHPGRAAAGAGRAAGLRRRPGARPTASGSGPRSPKTRAASAASPARACPLPCPSRAPTWRPPRTR